MISIAVPKSQKITILSAMFFAWVVGYADRIVMSVAIIPISSEFSLNPQQAGILLSAFYLSYATMQLFGGWMSDRYGSRIILISCIIAWSIFTGLTSFAWSFATLVIVRFLFGLGEGCFSPASSVTIAEVFPKEERARAKSLLLSTAFLGKTIGSTLIGFTIAYLGWRGAFHILAILGVLTAIVLWFSLKSGISLQKQQALSRSQSKNKFKEIFKNKQVWKLTVIWFFASAVNLGMMSWMPSFLKKQYNIDLLHIGIASAIPYAAGFFGTNAIGWMLDKFGQGREKYFMMLGSIGCAMFLSLMITTTSIVLLVMFWTLCMLSFNFIYATVFSIPLKYVQSDLIGSATGIMNFGGQIAGAIVPIVMGILISIFNGSYYSAFIFLVVSAILAFCASFSWHSDKPLDLSQRV